MPTLDPHRNPTEHSSLISPPPPPGKFRRVTFLLCVYLIVGVIIFYLVMDQMSGTRTNRVLDALYLVIVTMTSVGCGDLVPNSDTTKLLACAFVFTGVAIVGTYLSKLADHMVEKQEVFFKATQSEAKLLSLYDTSRVKYKLYTVSLLLGVDVVAGTVFLWKFFEYLTDFYTERRQKAIAKWLLTRDLTTIDLERADLDGDRQVGAAEFVLFKLKELGKINQEEISLLVKEFETLCDDKSVKVGRHRRSPINIVVL
ncbi:hypothetical protein HU200_004399 [Digitaria exilis]|uniref:Potassium channel domain-containing protein n=1 Tax=Digitaria exilis TaxID=1010633 RepID=A0A835FTJ4_9POAL|nr:hypothetical protein HU200_004399 [Digitaria exilis]